LKQPNKILSNLILYDWGKNILATYILYDESSRSAETLSMRFSLKEDFYDDVINV